MNCWENVNNSLVYDFGSSMIRSGFAGDAFPSISIPSVCHINEADTFLLSSESSQLHSFGNVLQQNKQEEIVNIINDSYSFSDPKLLSDFFLWSLFQMGIQGAEISALFTYPSHLASNTGHRLTWQHTLCEVGFEAINFPSISLSHDSTLSTYAQCLQTATVIDFGWSCLRVVPVIEGKPQYDQIKIHPIGGYGLSQLLSQQLGSRNIAVDPKNEVWTPSQFELERRKTLTEILQNCCSFASSVIDEDFLCFLNERPIDLKSEMTLISNLHFNQIDGDLEEDKVMPLPQLIADAISECNDSSKRKLWNNIISSGGFSRLSSFIDKVQDELKSVVDPTFNMRVQYPMNNMTGYENQVWTGGSIFASSSIFPHFLISKKDWEENGDSILNVKFK